MVWGPGTSTSFAGIGGEFRWYCRWEGYYVETFFRERCVTQGEPLCPTIFNVVVDAVFCHWEFLVAERSGGVGGGSKKYHAEQRQ